ncbi:MAG TPA: response regulator [Nitrospiraceae bacterium]|nr:response regulator [Nitrospiraceae bacterium]
MANILVVDDDKMMRDLLSLLLTRKGHHVFTVDHGQKGIDLFRRERPHVTILDFNMPDLDGLEVLRQIRAIDPHAPVIMLTGAGTEAREKQARELRVTDFLAKGFSLHEIGAALNRILKQPDQDAGTSTSSR